jgi:hypothetical protein
LPGQTAQPFKIAVLNGTFYFEPSTDVITPIIVHAYSHSSAFVEALWTKDDSIDDFLTTAPNNTRLLFLSQSETALGDALLMHARVQLRLDVLNFTNAQKQQWMNRMFFGTTPTRFGASHSSHTSTCKSLNDVVSLVIGFLIYCTTGMQLWII